METVDADDADALWPLPLPRSPSLSLSSASGGGAQSPRWLRHTYPPATLTGSGTSAKWPPPHTHTSHGGPSCLRVASQEERMQSAVCSHPSLTLPSSARQRNQIIDSRFVSLCLDFFYLILSIFLSLHLSPSDTFSIFWFMLPFASVRAAKCCKPQHFWFSVNIWLISNLTFVFSFCDFFFFFLHQT